MEPAIDATTVVIRPSLRVLVDPRTLQDINDLVQELTDDGHVVTLQLPDPGQFSVQNSLETVGIYVLGGVTTPVLSLMATDIYKGTKRWLVKRFTKNEKASAQHVTIYGPDNKPLKNVLGRSADHIVELPTKPPKPEDR